MTRPTEAVRIAAAQYPLDRFSSLGAYVDKVSRWVGEAASAGANLLVFPEYGATEYAGAFGRDAETLGGLLGAVSGALSEMDAAHAQLARRHDIHILAASGPCCRPDGGFTNRARLFAPSGRVGIQDKLIMTPFERDWGVTSGQDRSVFQTALGTIGIAICYDSEFPLLVRSLCEAGAEIILIPSCTEFLSGYHRVRTAALARALENGCATVQAPTVGLAPWSPATDRNRGAAGIFVPAEQGFSDTGVLATGEIDRPQWVYAPVDLAALERLRKGGEMRNTLDWARQPDARPLSSSVQHHDLR